MGNVVSNMIHSKYITPLAILAIILAVVLVLALGQMAPIDQTKEANQAEYVTQVLDKDSIANISIQIKQEDWDWLIENATDEEYRSCDITINGTTYYHVGIRPKGNSSLSSIARDNTSDRFSFKVSFDEYVDGQNYYGITKLALNNTFSDASYMKEYLSYDMFAFMNIATPAYAYTDIEINGEPWGFYLAVEVMEESFLQRNYGSTEGNLYKPEGMDMGGKVDRAGDQAPNVQAGQKQLEGEIKNGAENDQRAVADDMLREGGPGGGSSGANLVYNGDDTANYSSIFDNTILKSTNEEDWQKVIEMIESLNTGTNLEEYIDVDEVLRYFAVNTFLVNMDSYTGNMKHNYYLYEEKGVFQILPWDFNLAFGGFGIQSADNAINFPIDTPVTDTMENSPLIAKLLEVPEYQDLYHQYLNQLVKNYVESGIYQTTINRLDTLISPYVKNDVTAFFTYEEYKNSLPNLLQYGADRAASINAQLIGEQPSDTYGTLATSVDLKALGSSMGGGFGGMPGENQNNNGQDPGVGNNTQQNPNGQNGIPGDGNMTDRETMSKVQEILESTSDGELTTEQMAELKALGLDEEMIERLKDMPIGQNGNFAGGNAPGERIPGQKESSNVQDSKYSYMIIVISILFLLATLIFVQRFKRKRNSC